MKTYRSHKVVEAAKIVDAGLAADTFDGSICVLIRTDDGASHALPRHDRFVAAVAGDYLVKYDGGYLSVSPAPAFEAGYTEVSK